MMEFEEEEHEEEEEEEEEDDEMAITPTFKSGPPGPTNNDKKPGPPPGPIAACRYRECLKNHAVGIGGHAVDGCGEFMPAGTDGSLDALKCAACNCHRNFHRKEQLLLESSHHQLAIYTPPTSRPHFHPQPPQHHHQHQVNFQFYPYNNNRSSAGDRNPSPSPSSFLHQQPAPRPLALPSPAAGGAAEQQEEEAAAMTMMMTSSCRKKRFRTKFTQEQKDKMLELAEQLGWKIQKQDETAVVNFCNETGLKRHVLKVWMHNNKHTLGKKDQKP